METTFARMQDCKNARNDLKCIFSEFFTQIICFALEILLPLHCQQERWNWNAGQQKFAFRPGKIFCLPRA